jgi:hypothetical protein
MDEPTIKFPVTCPNCGTEALGEHPFADITLALMNRTALRLFAPCGCQYSWIASETELEQIREYLEAYRLSDQQHRSKVDAIASQRNRLD